MASSHCFCLWFTPPTPPPTNPLIMSLMPRSAVLISGVHYHKSCASSGPCLIASSGYQQFCTGKLNSVCITCCSTPLCNGPRQKKRPQQSAGAAPSPPRPLVLALCALRLLSSWC